jgi:AcrR family transcriptional regulator
MPARATEPKPTRELILDCAARLFRDHGYAAISQRDIAAAAGIQAASLYHHFSSKDEIVIEVLNIGVQSVFEHVRESIEQLPSSASPQEAFTTAVSAHVRSLLELQHYTSANIRIFGHTPDHVRAATLRSRRRYDDFWLAFLEKLARDGLFAPDADLALMRQFLFGAMNGTLDWFRPGRGHSINQIGQQLSTAFLTGYGAIPVARALSGARARRPAHKAVKTKLPA